jgi:hypothetical protein
VYAECTNRKRGLIRIQIKTVKLEKKKNVDKCGNNITTLLDKERL